ncbi:MAG TPA: hypothetical protein VN709_03700 [Terriglobales bacterium]|nr:hypothetical protein [Terriglobales bacterium]
MPTQPSAIALPAEHSPRLEASLLPLRRILAATDFSPRGQAALRGTMPGARRALWAG